MQKKNLTNYKKTYFQSIVNALEERRHGRKKKASSSADLLKKKSHGGSLEHFVSCCFSALSWPGNILSVAFPAENRCLLFSLLVRSQLVVKHGHHKIASMHGNAKNTFVTCPLYQKQIIMQECPAGMGRELYPCSQDNQHANLPVQLGLSWWGKWVRIYRRLMCNTQNRRYTECFKYYRTTPLT